MSTESAWPPPPDRAPAASACEPYREVIEAALAAGRNATAIWQDLVDDHGFTARYASVKRYVARLKASAPPEAHPSIFTPPGEEAQVDYGEGPMVRHPETGKYRRTRLFVLTLGFSRKSIRLLTFKSSTRIWAELHERAFRRLGGVPRIVVLDNLKEGVLEPEIYDPVLNPLFRDLVRHYGAVAVPARVGHPDRKGKVESGVGHAQKMPLKGLRFETLEEAQAYLDRWEERWADTRIHGTTKRQVAAMFAEERQALQPLPVEPFRYYAFGKRPVHLDGCVEIESLLRAAARLDRPRDPRPVGRAGGAAHRPGDRQAPARAPPRRARPPGSPPRRPAEPDSAHHHRPPLPRRARRQAHRDGGPADQRGRRRGRRAPHPGRPVAREEARRRHRRRRLRRRAGDGRPQLPLRKAVPRARLPAAPRPQAGRPPHPPAHRVPRPHRPHDQEPT